ncbi:DinB family protein [Empedobacter sedimenti]|uniref:DinB family protein n=1 Tax=Empedobacter sedimenti TaxID=3042610 RepID=UPI0024A6B015|nr:DinB family protein [Empedobacter sedimenti]
MNIIKLLQNELQNEYQITKEFIAKFPENKTDYKPHEKSMDITTLSNHIVEIFAWPALVLQTDKLDFAAGDYKPTNFKTTEELLKKLDEDYQTGNSILNNATEEDLTKNWKITSGEMVFADYTKYEAIRHALNQITHHRAQLGVFYRLLDIALPSSYGPSADSEKF